MVIINPMTFWWFLQLSGQVAPVYHLDYWKLFFPVLFDVSLAHCALIQNMFAKIIFPCWSDCFSVLELFRLVPCSPSHPVTCSTNWRPSLPPSSYLGTPNSGLADSWLLHLPSNLQWGEAWRENNYTWKAHLSWKHACLKLATFAIHHVTYSLLFLLFVLRVNRYNWHGKSL